MKFKKVIVFSLKDFNDNNPNGGHYPQDGHVINVFYNVNKIYERVAVGFE